MGQNFVVLPRQPAVPLGTWRDFLARLPDHLGRAAEGGTTGGHGTAERITGHAEIETLPSARYRASYADAALAVAGAPLAR